MDFDRIENFENYYIHNNLLYMIKKEKKKFLFMLGGGI